jgi:hypothetical protein
MHDVIQASRNPPPDPAEIARKRKRGNPLLVVSTYHLSIDPGFIHPSIALLDIPPILFVVFVRRLTPDPCVCWRRVFSGDGHGGRPAHPPGARLEQSHLRVVADRKGDKENHTRSDPDRADVDAEIDRIEAEIRRLSSRLHHLRCAQQQPKRAASVCFQFFISFWEVKKLNDFKNTKLETTFHKFSSFSLFTTIKN